MKNTHYEEYPSLGAGGRFELSTAFLAVCGASLFVHWNAYDIASYASGPTSLVIPLDSVPLLRQ